MSTFSCQFCYTECVSEEALFLHQKQRGHWIDMFAGKRRIRGETATNMLGIIGRRDAVSRDQFEAAESRLKRSEEVVEINGQVEVWRSIDPKEDGNEEDDEPEEEPSAPSKSPSEESSAGSETVASLIDQVSSPP